MNGGKYVCAIESSVFQNHKYQTTVTLHLKNDVIGGLQTSQFVTQRFDPAGASAVDGMNDIPFSQFVPKVRRDAGMSGDEDAIGFSQRDNLSNRVVDSQTQNSKWCD